MMGRLFPPLVKYFVLENVWLKAVNKINWQSSVVRASLSHFAADSRYQEYYF